MTKNWSTWFYSDPHFGHDNVIDFCDRPFKNKDEMKETFIANFNKLVSPEDLTIFGGDVFFYHKVGQMQEVLSRLNGRKVLIRGNHDLKPRQMMSAGFTVCVEEMTMVIAGERVLISHYPFRMNEWKYQYIVWKNKFLRFITRKSRRIWPDKYHLKRPLNKGQFLLHGHTHRKEKVYGRAINIGVDAWDYKPINIQEIANLIEQIKKNEENA